jgi:hypothetical protein
LTGVEPMARPDIKASDHAKRNPIRSGKPQNGPGVERTPEPPTLGVFLRFGQQQRGTIGGKDSTREGSDCSSAASTKNAP